MHVSSDKLPQRSWKSLQLHPHPADFGSAGWKKYGVSGPHLPMWEKRVDSSIYSLIYRTLHSLWKLYYNVSKFEKKSLPGTFVPFFLSVSFPGESVRNQCSSRSRCFVLGVDEGFGFMGMHWDDTKPLRKGKRVASVSCLRHIQSVQWWWHNAWIWPSTLEHLGDEDLPRAPPPPRCQFSSELRRKKESAPFVLSCVGCLVLRPIVPAFLEEVAR